MRQDITRRTFIEASGIAAMSAAASSAAESAADSAEAAPAAQNPKWLDSASL